MKVTLKLREEQDSIDWNKRQLVVSKNSGRVIQTTGKQDGDLIFSGMELGLTKMYYSNDWLKENFTLYKGSITLEND